MTLHWIRRESYLRDPNGIAGELFSDDMLCTDMTQGFLSAMITRNVYASLLNLRPQSVINVCGIAGI